MPRRSPAHILLAALGLALLIGRLSFPGTRPASALAVDPIETPAVLLLSPAGLARVRAAVLDGDPESAVGLAQLRNEANQALGDGPFTVTNKVRPAPGNDPHDYTSLSIYWWPNPQAPDGLPYLQRDGERNPEADDGTRYDARSLGHLASDVETLSLMYYLTGEEPYARHAAALVRAWFLDPVTRMNPNLRYAQIIPGRDAVRGIGIIDGRNFTRLIDGVALIGGCSCWAAEDQAALQSWFRDLTVWLLTSPNGKLEAKASNNHGVWYDLQVVTFALFAGDSAIARAVSSAAPAARIATQIQPDGSQPHEQVRTRSIHYSNFNLQAFFELATVANQTGVDLWSYQSPDGSSLRGALDFLVPYISGAQEWPYQEITPVDSFAETSQILARAATLYPDGPYQGVLTQLAAGRSALELLKLSVGLWPA